MTLPSIRTNHLAAACFSLLPLLIAAGEPDEWFAPVERVADYRPKGPSHCFRQFNIDWSWIAREPERIPEFLGKADPAALAQFCSQAHVDGTVVMAVPHHGYCTHETRVGTKFPGMQGDWFGRTITELHRRGIAAFGYVTLNWNWKYMRENEGRDFIHGRLDRYGARHLICLNAPGYLDLVEAYTREVLENYPVDGMRWDILLTAPDCLCEGCRRFYGELYGEDLTSWKETGERRRGDFHLATTRRVVERLRDLCKGIKPSVEIWQNCLNSYHENDLEAARSLDIAYNEFGDPFRLQLLRGITGKDAVINGLMNKASPAPGAPLLPLDRREWRTCLALGGRCYSYYGHKMTDPQTVLPGPELQPWFREQLAPFYDMVAQIEPFLKDAVPVAHAAVVYAERTRYRFPKYDRAPYIAAIEPLARAMLERSAPLAFVNALDLSDPVKGMARFPLLILPLTSGLLPGETAAMRRWVEDGGTLLVAGEALLHDERGAELRDFALAREMGLSFRGRLDAGSDLPVRGTLPDGESGERRGIRRLVQTQATSGKSLLKVEHAGQAWPLLHVSPWGKGRVVCLTSLDEPELTLRVVDWLAGAPPVRLIGAGSGPVLLTRQDQAGRWILHVLGDGDCEVILSHARVPASKAAAQFPPQGWSCDRIRGAAQDRLAVLE